VGVNDYAVSAAIVLADAVVEQARWLDEHGLNSTGEEATG
jgi:hypothetical protein